MKKQIEEIFLALHYRSIDLDEAEKRILALFTELSEPKETGGGNTEQWVINTNQKEVEELRRFRQEYYDFWEWYEDAYGRTEKELWDEYENK